MESQKPKIALYVKRPFGDKLNATMDFIKENWKPMLKFCTYLILPLCLIQAISMNGIMGGAMGIAAAKEAGTNLQPQGIYKDNEPETLGVIQHLRINGQSEVPGQNTGKKDKGNAKRNATNMNFAQSEPNGGNQGKNDNCLQSRMFDKETI